MRRAGKNSVAATAEIRDHRNPLAELRATARNGRVTLVFAARDEVHNDAVVLRDVLLGR